MLISSGDAKPHSRLKFLYVFLTVLILTSVFRTVAGQILMKKQDANQDDAIRNKVLQPALKMLKQKKVPFDTRLLLDRQWKEKLMPTFEHMPEFTKDIHIAGTMQGVYFARMIFLPEQVELRGDTVILVRELVPDDENSQITISGEHRLVIFVIGDPRQYGAMRKTIRKRGSSDSLHIKVNAPCAIVGVAPTLGPRIQCRELGFVSF